MNILNEESYINLEITDASVNFYRECYRIESDVLLSEEEKEEKKDKAKKGFVGKVKEIIAKIVAAVKKFIGIFTSREGKFRTALAKIKDKFHGAVTTEIEITAPEISDSKLDAGNLIKDYAKVLSVILKGTSNENFNSMMNALDAKYNRSKKDKTYKITISKLEKLFAKTVTGGASKTMVSFGKMLTQKVEALGKDPSAASKLSQCNTLQARWTSHSSTMQNIVSSIAAAVAKAKSDKKAEKKNKSESFDLDIDNFDDDFSFDF